MQIIESALVALLFAAGVKGLPEPRTSSELVRGPPCCAGCSYPGDCCCPRLLPVTSTRATTKKVVRTTTVPIWTTKWTIKTVTSTVVGGRAKLALRGTESFGEETAPSSDDPGEPLPEKANENDFESREMPNESYDAAGEKPEVEGAEQVPLKLLATDSSRHLCPACPPNANVKSLLQISSARTTDLEYCCPPRKTVWRTATRFKTLTRRIRRTFTVRKTRTTTVTLTARQSMSGRLFFDRNGNSAYDAGVDQYVSNQTFLLTRQASARRLEERARVEIVRTTTGFNGEYSFSVFATLRPNEPVYLNFVNLPNVREFTFFADGSGMLPKLGPLNFATTTTTAAFVSPKPRTSTSTTKTTFTSTSKSRTSTGFPVPTYLPVGLIGSTANDVNKGSNLVIDPSGDVYVAGLYSGDLTIGTTNLTHRGSGDGLIVKLNGTTGQVIWTVNFGNSSADHVDAIMLSRDGQVLLAMGPYNGTIQIGPFVTGDYDWWMAGLNPVNGAVIWASSMAGPSLKDWTGSFASAVGSGNVAAIGGTIGNKCIHARVNASSGYWRMEFFDNDPLGWTDCNRMAAMPTGDLVMVGSTTSDISIWGCPSYTAIGSPDAFVARTSLLLFSIDCRWITGLRTSGMDSAFTAVAVDTSGNIYAAGRMAVFGDRIYEAIVAKFDGAGLQIAFTWFMGPNGDESVSDIVVDPTGTFLLLAVHTTNTTSLDFGLGNMFGQPAGLYLVKMSLTLTAVASAYVGPITGASIRINPTNDHIFLSGTYVGAEPVFRSGLAEATAHGGSDIIVLELGANMGPLRS